MANFNCKVVWFDHSQESSGYYRTVPEGVPFVCVYESILGNGYAIKEENWLLAKGRILLAGTDMVFFDEETYVINANNLNEEGRAIGPSNGYDVLREACLALTVSKHKNWADW